MRNKGIRTLFYLMCWVISPVPEPFIPNTTLNGALPTFGNRLYALTGTSPQTLMLNNSDPIFSNLSINNSGGGIVMTSNVSVLSTLYMVNGNITTGSNTLSLGTSISGWGDLKRTTGTIIGNFARFIPAGSGAVGYDFPVGTANSFNDASVWFIAYGPADRWNVNLNVYAFESGRQWITFTDGTLVLNSVNPAGYWSINGNSTTASANRRLLYGEWVYVYRVDFQCTDCVPT